MPTPLISPNLHVILIHYPLAMLMAGTLIELFSFLWRGSTFRLAGRWMILIGGLSTIPATFAGIYALRDVARVDADMRWTDLKAESPVLNQPEIWTLLHNHVLYQSVVTGIMALLIVVWLGCSDRLRKSLHVVFVLILLFAVSIMTRAAWFGGEAIYRRGVAVEKVFPIPVSSPLSTNVPATWINAPTKLELMFPPVELHAIAAGTTIAIALVAIGLSFRKITATYDVPMEQPIRSGQRMGDRRSPRTPPSPVDMARTFNPDVEMEVTPFVPAGRFWMLAFVLAISTALGGIFVTARSYGLFAQAQHQPKQFPKMFWEQIYDPEQKINRLVAHASAGAAIILTPLILAALSRYAPRERLALLFFTAILICAVAAQIWLGVLLLFDTSGGPINHFNPPGAVSGVG